MILLQQSTQNTNPENRPLLSENSPVTPSGVNSLFPEKLILDLRNGITCEVLIGYGWNLVVRTRWDSEPKYGSLIAVDPWVTST